MSMRSANNPRTQNREYTGATRKGASSAKPARAAASSVRVVPASSKARRREAERGESLEGLSKEEKRERRREQRAREDRVYDASNIMIRADLDYKKLRRIFWTLLGLGVVFIAGSYITLIQGQSGNEMGVAQIVFVVLSYVAIIGAFVFDLVKIRPIRNYYRSVAEGMSERKIVELLETEAAEKKDKSGSDDKAAKGSKASGSSGTTVTPAKKKPKKNQRSRH